MATNGKDTIYIDIDDEITTIIEKVRSSSEKIVALVLPKRATVFQSIVNMKLLKRSADNDKKHLVLITSEAGLLPLAGTVGLYVAKTLQSKPEIPGAAAVDDAEEFAEEPADTTGDEDFSPASAANRTLGELAGATAVAGVANEENIETLQLDDEPEEADVADEPTDETDTAKPKKDKKDKKLAVPNFNKFRKRLLLLVPLLLLLIIGWYICATILPKATITLTTDTSSLHSNLTFSLSTSAQTLDTAKSVVPANLQQLQKDGSQQVPTTGKKNNGQQASGKVTLSLTDCSTTQVTVPAGTAVSSNNLTYITQADATMQSVKIGSQCKNSQFTDFSTATVNVTAQTGGSQYNVAASTTFTVSGYPGVSATNNDALSGGTDNIIQTVTQADIDSATQKITTQNSGAVKTQLEQQLQQSGMYALLATFTAGTPKVTTSAQVGDQAATVTVTQTTDYSMFGVKEADLKTLVDSNVKDQLDPGKQVILNEGLNGAEFKVNSLTNAGGQIALSTTVTAGPDLNASDIKKSTAGLRSGEVQNLLKADPGVSAVDVHFSPFWVSKVPHKADKVTVIFQKSK